VVRPYYNRRRADKLTCWHDDTLALGAFKCAPTRLRCHRVIGLNGYLVILQVVAVVGGADGEQLGCFVADVFPAMRQVAVVKKRVACFEDVFFFG
jgi:hypothetical protein